MDNSQTPTLPGFTLHALRGHGATSTVYSARRDLDGWVCAIKVFAHTSDAQDAAAREVTALSGVRVSGLIRLHDVVTTTDGRTALVLDLAEGGPLREFVEERGKLTPREVLGVARSVLAVLVAVHSRKIVHADLSPSNILISADGRAVVGDLGSSRFVEESGHSSTGSGTRGFIAPEVLLGMPVSAASDIYAFGASMWTILTGQIPGGLLEDTQGVPEHPTELFDLLRSCLAAEPERRPTAQEAQAMCETLGPDEPLSLPDGPDLGGRLTHRLQWQSEEMDRTEHTGTLAATLSTSRTTARLSEARQVGRHRDGRNPHPAVVLAATCARMATCYQMRIAASAVLGISAGLGLWWGTAGPDTIETASITRPVPTTSTTNPSTAGARATSTLPTQRSSPQPKNEVATVTKPSAGASTTVPHSAGAADKALSGKSASEPAQILSGVLNARASAYATAEVTALANCYAPDAPGYDTATSDVERLRRAGIQYRGLAYVVRDASPITGVGTDRLAVQATVDTKPYQIVPQEKGDGGVQVPAEQGIQLTYQLQRTPFGWRLAGIDR
ncbi:serine/threonine-protein kinase [Austwickia chelonae]|uniref:serine/threonine-protein kinase n=1 Tax=Austwickia chelonae TaxID=100225 RepID=UPI000E28257B